MTKRINEDWKKFRDVVSGRTRKALKKFVKSGGFVKQRPRGGKMKITIPRIDIPYFRCGETGEGLGRGEGKEGDVVARDPQPGDGQGQGQAGDEEGEGIQIQVDLDEVLKFMQDELKLPEMKPKPNPTHDDTYIKYNDISKVGPESLRHNRRTMWEALKRLATTGKLGKKRKVTGSSVPMNMITPINSDRRYRQYKEIKIPSSKAAIFFARDYSASMDDYRCDIVSDMSWWIDCWIRRFYKRVDRCYFVHDVNAVEVSEDDFYALRYGGGTRCSSVFRTMADQLKDRFPPASYNIYVFYFTDGENQRSDNDQVIKTIKNELNPEIVNMLGIAQICPWSQTDTVKDAIESAVKSNKLSNQNIRTTSVGEEGGSGFFNTREMTDEERDAEILHAIRMILSEEPTMD